MYCVKCGVKLADTEKQCPLCGTIVFHPDIERVEGEALYPHGKYPAPQNGSKGPLAVVTAIFLLPILIVLLCDMQLHHEITWSGYVVGALLTGYVILVLPYWFRKPNPVIFVVAGFVAIELYLLYINQASGGDWFLSFAFPVAGGIGLIVTVVTVLLRYVKKGVLYIIGGASIALGGFSLLIEFFMNLTFHHIKGLSWSMYPLVVLVLLGGVLIYLAINRNARETMERKFFI